MANQLSFSITARNAASTAMNALQKQVNSLKNGLNSLGNNTNSTSAYLNSLNRNVSSSNTVFGSLGRTVRTTIGIFGGFKLVNSILNLFTSNLDRAIQRADTMDLFSQKMELITNDTNAASRSLEELKTATKGTPYALDVAAKGVQNFVLRGMQAGEAVDSVKIWMDAVSTYGKGTNEQFESVMDAIAKMRTKGTVEMRYLNRLFAAGINPVQIYATATGQAAEDVQTALTNKDITAKDFLDTVEKAMREGTNGALQLQGNAKRLATTWTATMQNMSIAIARGILEVVNGIDKVASLFNDKGLKGVVADFGSSTESLLSGIGDGIGLTVGGFQKVYSQLRSENERTFNAVDQRVALNRKYMTDNFVEAGGAFREGFFNAINPQLVTIVEKFLDLRDTWSSVSLVFSKGINQISDPLGRLLGTYLGQTITSVEDLGIAFGNWLNLKLPDFFDKLEGVLNWLIDHKDGVVTAVKAMIKAMLGLGILQTLQGVLVSFNDKLKALNSTLAFFTRGKLQIPTFENLAFGIKNSQLSGLREAVTLEKELNTANLTNKANRVIQLPELTSSTNTNRVKKSSNKVKRVLSPTSKELPLVDLELGAGKSYDSSVAQSVKRNKSLKKAQNRLANNYKRVDLTPNTNTNYSRITSLMYPDKKTQKPTLLQRAGNWLINDAQIAKQRVTGGTKAVGKGLGSGIGNFFGTMLKGFKGLGGKKENVGDLIDTSGASEKVGILSKAFEGIKGVITTFKTQIASAAKGIATFFTTTAGGVTSIVLATAAIGALAAGLGVFNPGNVLSDSINSFFDTFFEWCSTFAQNAPTLIQSFVDGLIKNLPQLVSQGVNLLLSLVNGIMTGIPKLLTVGVSVLFALIGGIAQVLPDLVQQGFSAIGQFIAGIIQNLPNVLAAGWELLQTIVTGILYNLPIIIASGIKLVWSLISGIGSMVGQVGDAVIRLVSDGWNYLVSHPEQVGEAIWNACMSILNALNEGLWKAADILGISGFLEDVLQLQRPEGAIEKGKEAAENAVNGANTALQTKGIDLQNAFQQANIDQANADAANAGQQMGQNVTQGVDQAMADTAVDASQAGVDTGTNYVDGITQGVSDSSGNVDTALSSVGSEGMAQLTVNFNGEQVQQAAGGLIDTLTRIINERSLDVAMAMASMANNSMITLAASFQALPEDIPNAISVAMTAVVDSVNMKVQEICTNVKNNLTAAKTEADVATQQLSTAIQNNFLAATTSVNASLEQMKTDVYARYEELRAGVIEKLGAIESAQTTFSTEHMATFQSNMQTYEGYILADYQSFCDQLKGKMDDLVRHSLQTGKDMMTEMANGISSNMQKVLDVASDLVKKLKETFEKGLGVHSPSRYTYWLGQMLLAGLMNGMSPEAVQKFIDSVVGDMQNAFNNGKYQAPNADEAVNFLSDQGTLDLIGRVSKVDTKDMNPQQIAYPLIGTMGSISSPFGRRSSPGGIGSTNHAGMDIAAGTGTPIASALAGTVTTAGWYGGYGNAVVVDSGNGLSIVYGHMSQVLSSVGQVVQKGQQIGLVGSTGNSTGPHLHFEMRNNGDPFDPAPYLGGAAVSGVGNTLAALLQMAYNKKHGIITGSNVMYNPSAGAAQWSSVVLQALAMLGQPASLLNYVLYAIERESSGNPNAINLTDSNAAAGHPSQGLLQTIPSTFAAYRNPNLANSLTDPLANIYAGLNYMIQRYGGIEQVVVPRMNSPRGWYGYAVGTRYVPFDMPAIIHQGEAIIPASQNPYSNSGGDYLGDLIANAMNGDGLNALSFDTSGMTSGNTNNSTTNNNLNNTFNITNSSDVDSDRSISEMESMLHRLLQDGKRVGVPR